MITLIQVFDKFLCNISDLFEKFLCNISDFLITVYNDHSPLVQKIQVFEKFFLSWAAVYNWVNVIYKHK